VYGYLQKMKFNEPVEIEFLPNEIIPSPIAKAFFVDIVKDFIKHGNGNHFGFYCEFNNSYEKIVKRHYVPFIASKQKDGQSDTEAGKV
jgi:hypothetical protein